jgi:magnesium transporter
VALAAVAWLGQGMLALCLLLGIGLGVVGAALIGVAIPNLLRLITGDPRLAAGPIALASADMFTLVLYLNLARWLL